MADISHEIVDECAIVTAVSDKGCAWMVEKKPSTSTLKFDLNNSIERTQVERFLADAREAGLEVEDAGQAN